MSEKKYFAIGCFNFGVKKNPPFEFKGSEYLKELEKQLSKISNLTNLLIETDDDFSDYKENISKKIINIQNGNGSFPNPLILDIEFDLYIPFKIQAKLGGGKKKYLRTYTENFKIRISNSFYAPVAVIECINPKKKNAPSSAVQIVREYIRNEFKEKKSDYIRFEYLGPSPFHLDCFLIPEKPKNDTEWLFKTTEFNQKGYDELTIHYNNEEFENADEAMFNLVPSIIDELGFYYSFQQERVHKMREWSSLQKKLNKLLKIEKSKGILGVYKKFFLRQKLIGKLFIGIATFEGQNIYGDNFFKNNYKQTFLIDEDVFFKNFIDKELAEKQEYPIKQISELINFLESRRVKSVELTMTIIAAILGGVVGALITIYMQ